MTALNAMFAGYGHYMGLAPMDDDGPISLYVGAVFGGAGSQDLDLGVEAATNQIPFVQAVYINNDGAGDFTIACKVTQQSVKVKANTQGFYPLICADRPQFTLTCSAAKTVGLNFLNVPVPAMQWLTA